MAVVRFAPSPTGRFHVGGARTALYNKLFAEKSKNNSFFLRIEDTDQSRYMPSATTELIETLAWLGLTWDKGPSEDDLLDLNVEPWLAQKYGKVSEGFSYVQSKRTEIYKEYAQQLLDMNLAYPVFTEEIMDTDNVGKRFSKLSELVDLAKWRDAGKFMIKKMLATEQPHYLMLKLPRESTVTIYDGLRGQMEVRWRRQHDSVLLKPDGLPTYHLASVVDDHLMNTTHVIRGEEWLSSLPLHFFLYNTFGWDKPEFIHLPVILNPTGKGKMSKRNGQDIRDSEGRVVPIFVKEYMDNGFLAEALVNFMALVGWNPKTEQEIMDWDELVYRFSFDGISKSGAAWNYKKLRHFNQEYIRKLSPDKFAELAERFV